MFVGVRSGLFAVRVRGVKGSVGQTICHELAFFTFFSPYFS